ncbi:type I-E CRISPR-associated protein Cse2/CasB [Schaalia naturae]|uniref:Type I-E CRISPR-associated protein Cse2/CasB n=1 Tax=Schaalia naturae TaxID=635203 RepID=A0ABW2SPA7_9ACTO
MTSTPEVAPAGGATDTNPGEGPLRTSDQVRRRVLRVAGHLLDGQSPYARAGRAQLRSALGKEIGSVPAIWQFTVDGGPSIRDDTEPTRGEIAVQTALTLWALHQGSHPDSMHITSEAGRRLSIAAAVRTVTDAEGSDRDRHETPIYGRLSALVRATTFDALATQARGIVNLLSSADVPMDYGQFAVDLFQWQDPRYRSTVTRRWGRDFERTSRPPSTDAPANAETSSDPS